MKGSWIFEMEKVNSTDSTLTPESISEESALISAELHQVITLGRIDGKMLEINLSSSTSFTVSGSHESTNREISGSGSIDGDQLIFRDTVSAFDYGTGELTSQEFYTTTATRIN